MTLFAHPERLWMLVALVPMAVWVGRGSRRRRRDWEAIGQSGQPWSEGSWGWLAAMALVILATGQPRWGRLLGSDAAAGHDVVLLVDVSRSMAAEDAVPDRLGVAIEAGSSLLQALRSEAGNRVSVVAFAARGVIRCPLTSDFDAATRVLRGLRPGDVQPGGTDLGAALDEAAGAFDDEDHADGRTIVLFSDGEDHVGSWTQAIDRLRAGGILVHSVAIGDPDRGHPLPSSVPKSSRLGGDPNVETRRSDLAFEAISKTTGGAFLPIGLASVDLGGLFRDRIEPIARRRRDEIRPLERVERFPAFLLPAIGLGLTASWPGLARRRGRRLACVAMAASLLSIGAGPPLETPAGLVAEGRRAYELGRFDEALAAFDRAIERAKTAAVPRFDAASALFQLGRYPEAILRYEEARTRGDVGLGIKIDYALGNAHLALGDVPEALAHYDACLATTLGGEAFDAVRLDAAANRAFAATRRKPPPEMPDLGDTKPPGTGRTRPTPRSTRGDRGDSNATEPTSPSDARPGPGQDGASASSPRGRGAGGAGGSGQAPPPAGSPDSRLDAALKDVREARSRRPPDPPPPSSESKSLGKDW